jgi:hypothetical protein
MRKSGSKGSARPGFDVNGMAAGDGTGMVASEGVWIGSKGSVRLGWERAGDAAEDGNGHAWNGDAWSGRRGSECKEGRGRKW